MGRCFANQGEFDAARQAYNKAIRSAAGEKTETAAMAQWMIGESYFHQKNYEAALREYSGIEFVYAYPTWQAAALLQAGKCRERLGEPTKAAEAYRKILKSYPNTSFAKDAAKELARLEASDFAALTAVSLTRVPLNLRKQMKERAVCGDRVSRQFSLENDARQRHARHAQTFSSA